MTRSFNYNDALDYDFVDDLKIGQDSCQSYFTFLKWPTDLRNLDI